MTTFGQRYEISRPYSMESGIRDGHDEYAGCECVVRDVRGFDALVVIKGSREEVWLPVARLRPLEDR